MKFTTLLASTVVIFASLSAHAVLQPPGTFVPAQCGPQTVMNFLGPDIHEVCIGSVVGESDRAVQFRMAEEPARTFRVVNQSTLGIGQNHGTVMLMMTLANDQGERVQMKVLQTAQGDITAVSGQLGDVGFVIPQFKTVFTVESL